MSKYVKLINGVIFKLEDLKMIVKQDLNDYRVILENCPTMAVATGDDVEQLEKLLNLEVLNVKPAIQS